MAILRKKYRKITPQNKKTKKLSIVIFRKILWWCWHLSGVRALWQMFFPPTTEQLNAPQYRKPSTLIIWFSGVYLALYGAAFGIYQSRVTQLENYANSIILQMTIPDTRLAAFSRIKNVQYAKCPNEPTLITPLAILGTLIYNSEPSSYPNKSGLKAFADSFVPPFQPSNKELANLLRDTSAIHKKFMSNANLSECYFPRADFSNANFSNANLVATIFKGSNLSQANFKNTNASYADFTFTNIYNATFSNAELIEADLQQSNAKNTNFTNADLSFANLTHIKLNGKTNFKGAILIGAKFNNSATPWRTMNPSQRFEDFPRNRRSFSHWLDSAHVKTTETILAEYASVPPLYKLLLPAATLYKAQLDPRTLKKIQEIKPELLRKPKNLSSDQEEKLKRLAEYNKPIAKLSRQQSTK